MQDNAPTGQQASQRAAVEALHDAAQRGDVPAEKALLVAGVDVDAPDASYYRYRGTAVTIAVRNLQPEVLQVLLAAGAAVNTAACRDGTGWKPLMLAAQGQVQYCDGDSRMCYDESPATWSIEPPEVLSMVRQLVRAGADVAADEQGMTALRIAADRGLNELCDILLAAGAPLEGFDGYDQTPLMAAVTGWVQIYKDYLTTRSELIDTTPQHLALVQRLLQAGAAVNAANSEGVTALHYAADPTNDDPDFFGETYSASVIAALAAADADVNQATTMAQPPCTLQQRWAATAQ